MKRLAASLLAVAALWTTTGCTTIGEIPGRLAGLNGICIEGYAYRVIPRTGSATVDTIEFQIELGNPQSVDVVGSLRLMAGVTGTGIEINGIKSTVTAQSQAPYFEIPVSTVYPAHKSDAYISPVLISMAYDPNATYSLEYYSWIAGLNNDLGDKTPCHMYKITKTFPRP